MSSNCCEICLLDSSVDPVMWSCVGCTRKVHPACLGVVVPKGSLRTTKKDKKSFDPMTFVLPCCTTCQTLVTASFEFNVLVQHQKQLAAQINENTEVMHKLALQMSHPDSISEAVESIDNLLTAVKNELCALNKNNSITGSVTNIKNHITTVVDTAMVTTKGNIDGHLKRVSADLKKDLLNINNEINQLNQLTLDTASTLNIHAPSLNMQCNPLLELDIRDELKILYSKIDSIQENKLSPLTQVAPIASEEEINPDSSGWRTLGHARIWRADWSSYDSRKLRREEQQKQAAKAKAKRQRLKNARNHPTHNQNNDRNVNSINNRNRNTNSNNCNGYSNNIRNRNGSRFNYCNNNNYLPPDRELLAAAKDHFSKPPATYRRINFQRGEILNPYPTDNNGPSTSARFAALPTGSAPPRNSTTSCEACACRHTCFTQN